MIKRAGTEHVGLEAAMRIWQFLFTLFASIQIWIVHSDEKQAMSRKIAFCMCQR